LLVNGVHLKSWEYFMKILIAYDGSTHADIAIDDLQRAGLPAKAQALVLSAVEWPLQTPRTWNMVDTGFTHEWKLRVDAAEQLAEKARNRIQRYFPQWDVHVETPTDNPAAVILEKAQTWPADLIVVGTHGRSRLARAVLGSVSLRLVKEAPCSVRVARARTNDGPIRLIIGDDGSPEADAVVKEVCGRSWPAGTEAKVLAVQEVLVPVSAERIAIGERIYDQINEDERVRLRYVTTGATEKLNATGLIASPLIEDGDPKEILTQYARGWNADTIFIGARGLGHVERFLLGSVSSTTVAHAPCTVEVVRHR
jgi:nucleotide-binding universal stress UspA family protein